MKKIYSLFLVSLCVLWSTSCRDYLEFEETDLIAGDIALRTVENNESAIIGAYGAVNNAMDILLNAVFSDEVKTAGEFYNASTTHEWKYGPADVGLRDSYTAIDPQYQVIDRVNRVLALIETADSTRNGDNVLRRRLKGEALFLRALAHFDLYRYYGAKYSANSLAMPYMEESTMAAQARIVTSEYFQKLNRDITDAKALLPATTADINRANVVAANGLHARIALYSENWADAETYATAYINAVPLASLATFPGIWTDANTAEQAYRIVRTSTQPSTNPRLGSLFRATSASATNIGTVTWTTSDKLYDSYSATDIRRNAYFTTNATLAAANRPNPSRPGLIINKYAGGNFGTATENLVNSKMMRTSEMYLIRAEARAEQNKISGANSAESDLNTLRAARITDHVDITLSTKDQAISEILTERFKELAFEGHRFWDLKRRGLAVDRLDTDAPSSDGKTLPANSFKFALPIPDPEIKANPAMEQNPGY
jgi:hypothetical protein